MLEKRRALLDPTVGLFVSLYLILVAFFIVMNVISNQKTARAVAVMESLEDAFERPYPTAAKEPGLVPPALHPATESDFLLEAGELVASLLGPKRRYAAEGGNVLKFILDAHALFLKDSAELSEQAPVFFQRLAPLIAAAYPGSRREVAILFGQRGAEGHLVYDRADRLARAMEAAGISAASIGIGIAAQHDGRVVELVFRANDLENAQITFSPAPVEGGGR